MALKKNTTENLSGICREAQDEGLGRDEEEKKKVLSSVISTFHHFFGDFSNLFKRITDPRDQRKITYPLASLVFAGILMFLCGLKSRRQIGLLLRNGAAVENFKAMFDIDSSPHGDTLNVAFSRSDPDQFQQVVTNMTKSLIRKKILYPYRLLGEYFVVAVDGTGILTFNERHCPHCLTRTTGGKTLYYHNVLEAKIVTPDGFAFSLMTEFIENPGEKISKQDCELNAFYRLAPRLKQEFPRLPILLSMDGLFAGGPTFDLCNRYNWKFMIVLKDKDLPSVNEEFSSLSLLQTENRFSWRTGKDAEIKQDYCWVDNIMYIDSNKKEHNVSVLECLETKLDKKENKEKTKKFKWVTNLKISRKNVAVIANDGGRDRWKIENEGFNVQKNGGYELEHAYSDNLNSSKIFYFLLQIAHMVFQLLEKGSLLRQAFVAGFGSAKNLAFRILEAWRNAHLTKDSIEALIQARYQIRFDSS
jgi:hypothetical protein